MNNYSIPKLYDADGDLTRQWYVFYYYKHPETGVNERFKVAISRAIRTKSDRYEKSVQIKNDLKKKLLHGFNPFASNDKRSTSAAEALEYVRKYKIAILKKRSGFTYSSVINKFVEFLESIKYDQKSIDAISRDIAQQYMDFSIMSDKVSNRTYNNRLKALRTMFNFLIKKDYIEVNPFQKFDLLPGDEAPITAFTKEELKMISERLPDYNFNLYVASQLIFYCFLRPAELVRLQFCDLFWEHQIIVIPGSKSKNRKSEVIVMPDQLIKNLATWNRNYSSETYLFSNGKDLVPGQKEIAPTRIAEAWREFANENGIKKNIYDMKHTGNGMAFDQDLNARDIQLQNRHHSLDQTQEYLNKFRRKPSEKFVRNFSGY